MCNYCDYSELLSKAYENVFEKKTRYDDMDFNKLQPIIAPYADVHGFQYYPLTEEIKNKLKLLAGPHGHALFKILEARRD